MYYCNLILKQNPLSEEKITLKVGEAVDLLIGNSSPLGVNVIVNGHHEGLLYHNELFEPLTEGSYVQGYVKKVREDNKIDVSLPPFGYEKVNDNSEKILQRLNEQKGVLRLTDKSSPQEIEDQLQMSKKVFKKALGALYKQKLIRIEADAIYLNN